MCQCTPEGPKTNPSSPTLQLRRLGRLDGEPLYRLRVLDHTPPTCYVAHEQLHHAVLCELFRRGDSPGLCVDLTATTSLSNGALSDALWDLTRAYIQGGF